MNDALRTDVSVRFTPESIACASIWLAARELRVPLPEEPAWYEVVKVKLDDIHHIAASILKLYNREKVTLEQLETKVCVCRFTDSCESKSENDSFPFVRFISIAR